MTVCSLVLHSGFVVIGQSACIDPAKYDEAVGCEMARKNAVNQLWALEGYHVKKPITLLRQQWRLKWLSKPNRWY